MKKNKKRKKKRKANLHISKMATLLYLSKKVIFHCSRIDSPKDNSDPIAQYSLREYIGFQGIDALQKLSDFFKTFHLDHSLFELLKYAEKKNLNDIAQKVRNVMRQLD